MESSRCDLAVTPVVSIRFATPHATGTRQVAMGNHQNQYAMIENFQQSQPSGATLPSWAYDLTSARGVHPFGLGNAGEGPGGAS